MSEEITRRTAGRPKGSTDRKPRKKRTDSNQLCIASDDRLRILKFNNSLMRLPKIRDQRNNVEIISARIDLYLTMCEQAEILPTVAGLALALGIDRATLWDWVAGNRGTISNQAVVDTLKCVYSAINTQYEELLTQGKMIPVSAFFLMQNNHGYKQQTDHVITANNEVPLSIDDISDKAGLLTD